MDFSKPFCSQPCCSQLVHAQCQSQSSIACCSRPEKCTLDSFSHPMNSDSIQNYIKMKTSERAKKYSQFLQRQNRLSLCERKYRREQVKMINKKISKILSVYESTNRRMTKIYKALKVKSTENYEPMFFSFVIFIKLIFRSRHWTSSQ